MKKKYFNSKKNVPINVNSPINFIATINFFFLGCKKINFYPILFTLNNFYRNYFFFFDYIYNNLNIILK